MQNLLGALSVGIGGQIQASAAACVGHAGETAAAVVRIGTTPRISIEELSTVLDLSHSAAVRLVEKLTSMDLVKRLSGADKREVRLSLTRSGKTILKRIQAERSRILQRLVDGLPSADVQALSRILEVMMGRVASSIEEADHICRYCDEDVCPQGRCPFLPLQKRAAE